MSSDVELYRDNEEIYLTEQDKQLFTQVDDILAEAKERWDPSVLFGFGRELRKNVRVSGVALAKLLWGITDVWDYLIENNAVDDNVWDAIHSEMGVPPGTARPYVRIWESLFANPEISDEAKERLLTKPIRTLKLLPALSEEGDVDWEDIATAHDYSEMRKKVRAIRGDATSSGTSLYIKVDVRTGQLSAKQGDRPYAPFGILNFSAGDNDPVVKSAIERIIERTGIIES